MKTLMNVSEMVQIAETVATSWADKCSPWQTGKVWHKAGYIRVYVQRGSKDMGYIQIDDDGAVDMNGLNKAAELAPFVEAAVRGQVYGY